jgi:hypothetical protein
MRSGGRNEALARLGAIIKVSKSGVKKVFFMKFCLMFQG